MSVYSGINDDDGDAVDTMMRRIGILMSDGDSDSDDEKLTVCE